MPRPQYTQVDNDDREAQIGSRDNIFNKSFVTDLWMKVITKAIEDVALYTVMRKKGKVLREEDLDNEHSAISFLFDKNHKVPLDDYLVNVSCPKCKKQQTAFISTVAGQDFYCSECDTLTNKKYIEYSITKSQKIKEISLKELIALWGVEDMDGFRAGLRRRIDEIIEIKSKEIK
jgi:ribosomal protein S27E